MEVTKMNNLIKQLIKQVLAVALCAIPFCAYSMDNRSMLGLFDRSLQEEKTATLEYQKETQQLFKNNPPLIDLSEKELKKASIKQTIDNVNAARDLYEQKKYNLALVYAKGVIKQPLFDEPKFKAYFIKGQILFVKKNYVKAIENFESCVAMLKNILIQNEDKTYMNVGSSIYCGECHVHMAEQEISKKSFQKACEHLIKAHTYYVNAKSSKTFTDLNTGIKTLQQKILMMSNTILTEEITSEQTKKEIEDIRKSLLENELKDSDSSLEYSSDDEHEPSSQMSLSSDNE